MLVHIGCYAWRRFPVVISDTGSQAKGLLRTVRDELDSNERILADFGELRGPQWTEQSFVTRNGVRFLGRGAESAIRGAKRGGARPDFLVLDDFEDDEAVLTPERREKRWKWLTTAAFGLAGPDGMDRMAFGTPLHLDAAIRRLGRDAGWGQRRFPALRDDGAPAWPDWYGAAVLEAKLHEMGSLAYNQEYLLQPIDDAAKPFRREWLRTYEDQDGGGCPAHWWRFLYVDPAIGQKQTSDWFVATVVGASPPGERLEVRVLDQFSGRFSVAEQVQRMADLDGRWCPMSIGVEANAYQDALRQAVVEHGARTGRLLHVVPVYSTKAKRVRILGLSPRIEMGIVTFPARLASLMGHLADYPSVTHDDFEDSLAGAVQMVANTGRMAL